MLNWASRFNIFCFLDNQDYSIEPHRYDCLLAAGCRDSVSSSLQELDLFLQKKARWAFGHLSYELKQTTGLKEDRIGFPTFFFFEPLVLVQLNHQNLEILGSQPDEVFAEIMESPSDIVGSAPGVKLQQRLSREDYLEKIQALRRHIVRGDCYEINFCQEFFAEEAQIDPLQVFFDLTQLSPNPFSAFYRLDGRYLVCASPERFLTRRGRQLFSQPMKGTIRRDADPVQDARLKEQLIQSQKDRSENVMVVDMVRNDLSRVCSNVKVDELFGVYTYPQVHQMISTISGELKENIDFSGILQALFPMGSMTGAPKHRVMQLIDKYEDTARGIFSGSVGYFRPDGDFDFNVVIRSIMYNAFSSYLSYQVGSGITFYSDPQQEWEECLLKGTAIKKVLEKNNR